MSSPRPLRPVVARAAVAGLGLVLVAGGLSGCSYLHLSCSGFSNSFAADAKGEPTQLDALAAFLAARPDGYPSKLSSWKDAGGGRFTSGPAHVTVVAAGGGGFHVSEGSTC